MPERRPNNPYDRDREAKLTHDRTTKELPEITEELAAHEKAIHRRHSEVTAAVETVTDADIISVEPLDPEEAFDEDGPTTVKKTPTTPLSAIVSRPPTRPTVPQSGILKKK